MKYIIFGSYSAACVYADQHKIARTNWLHAPYWDRCAGLDPKGFRTVVLPDANKQALSYWYRRQDSHGRSPEDQKEWDEQTKRLQESVDADTKGEDNANAG